MLFVIPLLCLLRLTGALEIDPDMYGKLAMMNTPMHHRMAKAAAFYTGHLETGTAKIVDIGCGRGEPSVLAASMMNPRTRVLCTDPQAGQLEIAKAHAKEMEVKNIDFQVASVEDVLGSSTEKYDAILMGFVLMFLPDVKKTLTDLAFALKVGGYAIISVWKELGLYDWAHSVTEGVAKRPLPEFPVNPLNLRYLGAVEQEALGAGLHLETVKRMTYNFTFESIHEATTAALILAGGMVQNLQNEGIENATEEFYRIAEHTIHEQGWYYKKVDNRYQPPRVEEFVSIPGNTPQMLVLHKQDRQLQPKRDNRFHPDEEYENMFGPEKYGAYRAEEL